VERLGELTSAITPQRRKAFDFLCYAWELGRHGKRLRDAASEAERRFESIAPQVPIMLRSAAASGTTSDPDWALSAYGVASSEWCRDIDSNNLLGVLRAMPAPPHAAPIHDASRIPGTFAGGGTPIPMGQGSFSRTRPLIPRPLGALVAVDGELFKSFSPVVLDNLNLSLSNAVARAVDHSMLDPNIAASDAGPGSLLNGVAPIPSSGSDAAAVEADVFSLFGAFDGLPLTDAVVTMGPKSALHICGLRSNGARTFPLMTVSGGELLGVECYVSPEANGIIAVIRGNAVAVCDPELTTIETSVATALQLTDTPTDGAAPVVGMYQSNLVALRATRWLDYARIDDVHACAWMSVSY
jgi:hypothetical protein